MKTSFFNEYSRRDVLGMSLASMLGVSSSGWLPQLARAASKSSKHRSCILLWMTGGPAQTDTFDPKPDHENGGPTQAISTAVPGIQISENLPNLAKHAKDLSIIRTMSSREGDHGRATQLMLTGYRPQQAIAQPVLGALIAKELGRVDNELPNFISLSPVRRGIGGGPGFLGPEFGPLVVSGDSDNPRARANLSIENLRPPQGVDDNEMEQRFAALRFLQRQFGQRYEGGAARAHRANFERAARLIESQAKNAFRLEEESPQLREAYGRNRFGQGCLLARRLVERGVPFIEVTLANIPGVPGSWDTHARNFQRVQDLCQILDPAWSTLMTDLRDRELLDSTLVVWMGEFGRTPQINSNQGRDHFATGWSTVLAGAGIRGGQVFGDTGKNGNAVRDLGVDDTVSVPDFYATICAALGIDYEKENISPEGRPFSIVEAGGTPVQQLLS